MFQRDGASAFKKDLTHTLRLCEFLGHPEHQFKSIHVAGTNGKGSTSHYLAAILQQAGYKTGLYTSPHLKSFTERIKINGEEIHKQAVVDFVDRIKPVINEIKPSFFEITVAMCFDYFAKEQVDIAVIEVGMGGRLDSTNVILPEVSVITNISMDHQQWLGDTIEAIAREKAGIIKKNRPVVITEKQPETVAVFSEIASVANSVITFAGDNYEFKNNVVLKEGKEWLTIDTTSLPKYQFRNLLGVFSAIDILNERGYSISNEAITSGVHKVFDLTNLKGRWQKLAEKPLMYCDVGHNEAGIIYILDQINSLQFEKLHIVLGMVNDKDVSKILSLLPKNATYYFCQANIPRAMAAEALAEKGNQFGLAGIVIKNVNEAVDAARSNANLNDLIFIGGSNFVVAELDNL
ncbi:bifunctional folylpolyglutamate synthase/dihydrofolate synthase [Fulvivirga lutea]|uniref:Dihydrofolate synthase/folylpolyglutamate synthase n=2 Tax=Fulvivirga lutea TaxID=2810512 RepID=A0A974WK29_9BACT|nr:bifunctional folylpolyglutamate synthase/dihydrofolate synthase [Fulvivirga lutea]